MDGARAEGQETALSDTRGQFIAASFGPISQAIVRVARAHRMLTGQLLREVGLRPEQGALMMYLWENGPQRQIDLAEAFTTDSAAMTRTVQRLERGGFVRRKPDARDGRVTLVEPTPASLALRVRVERLWEQLERATTGGMTADDHHVVLGALHRLASNLLTELDQSTVHQP